MKDLIKYQYAALFASTDPQFKFLVESVTSIDELPEKIFDNVRQDFFVESSYEGFRLFIDDRSSDLPFAYHVHPLETFIKSSGVVSPQRYNMTGDDGKGDSLYSIPFPVVNQFSNHKFDMNFWRQLGKPFKGNLLTEFIDSNYRPWWSSIPLQDQWWLDVGQTHSTFIMVDVERMNRWISRNSAWIFDPMYDTTKLSDEKLFIRKGFKYNLRENNAIVVKVGEHIMVVVRLFGYTDDLIDHQFDKEFYF